MQAAGIAPSATILQILADLGVGILLAAVAAAILMRARSEPGPARARPIRALSAFFICSALAYLAGILALWLPVRDTLDVVQSATAALTTVAVLVTALAARTPAQADTAEPSGNAVDAATADAAQPRPTDARPVGAAALQAPAGHAVRAAAGAGISIFQQDLDLRYVWAHNPPPPLDAATVIGRRDEDLFPEDVAEMLRIAKLSAIESGETLSLCFELQHDAQPGYFDMTVHVLSNADGEPVGVSSVAVDVTERTLQTEKLQIVMRELAHRSKNLLAIIAAISNMTAKASDDPRAFHRRFEDRLRSLSDAHDKLTESDWTGAWLSGVVENQIAPFRDAREDAISTSGDKIWLKPNAVQYLTLALHELVTNAARHGALLSEGGTVSITWTRAETADDAPPSGLQLIWRETFAGPVGAPISSGFGKLILERAVPSALGGRSSLEITETGLTYVLDVAPGELA